MRCRPESPSNGGDDVAEGGFVLVIPSCGARAQVRGDFGVGGPQRQQREQSEQGRGRSRDGGVGRLPLRLDAEMRAAFLKGRLHRPSTDEPAKKRRWRDREIGAQERLRITQAGRIAYENPANLRRL